MEILLILDINQFHMFGLIQMATEVVPIPEGIL